MEVQHYQLLGQWDPAPQMEHWAALVAGMVSAACLKLLLHGVLLLQNPQMWLCWQSSSVQKPEFNISSCYIPCTSQNRISCSRNRSNTLGHLFQNKSTNPLCKQYLVCRKTKNSINQSINQCTYLNQHLLSFISCSNDQIFTCSQVIKGKSLLQTYIGLTPLDLPPPLCFYHSCPSVSLYYTHSVKKLTRKEVPADER